MASTIEFAQWLGVSIKQVKYLEHQRRNPSGPTRRLLGILAHQLGFEGAATVQVLGASLPQPKPLPMRNPRLPKAMFCPFFRCAVLFAMGSGSRKAAWICARRPAG